MIAGFPLTFWLQMGRGREPVLRQSAVIAGSMVQRVDFLGFRDGEQVPCCFFIGIVARGWSWRLFRLAARGGCRLLSARKAGPSARINTPERQPHLGADGPCFCDGHFGRRSFLS